MRARFELADVVSLCFLQCHISLTPFVCITRGWYITNLRWQALNTLDYRDRAIKKPVALEGVEFLRRFTLHILLSTNKQYNIKIALCLVD